MTRRKPTYNQADKVIARFGGITNLAKHLDVSRQTVYRWLCPRPKGTDGIIPSAQVARIMELAETNGVDISDMDWTPERTDRIEEMLS